MDVVIVVVAVFRALLHVLHAMASCMCFEVTWR